MGPLLSQHPSGMARWLAALDLHLRQPKEIAIVGAREDAGTKALLQAVYGRYLPNKVVAGMEEDDPMGAQGLPLLRFRTRVEGHSAAYVCQNYVCQLPVTEPEALVQQLEA